jgi:hypothetical protein
MNETNEKTYWKPLSRISLAAGVISALVFWLHAATDKDKFLLLDYVNLVFHEFGHLLFGFFGERISIYGGTISQLAFPIIFLANFYLRREIAGAAFSAFWFGENLLNISVYIADARNMLLPLVGGGEHDWNIILSGLNMLGYDEVIAGIVRTSGWLIMVSAIIWFVITGLKAKSAGKES